MVKILIVTTVEVGYDGLTNHILSYVDALDKTDLVIDLVSARGIDSKIVNRLNDVGFHSIYRLEYRDTNQMKYIIDLMKLIKREKYDIVHAHGNSATLALDMFSALLGGAKIRIAHSHNTRCEHQLINRILMPFFSMLYTNGFACGVDAGKWMFRKNDFLVIPNGKDIDKYLFDNKVRAEYRKILGLDANIVAIGNVAAFVHKKNHVFLLNVFKRLVAIKPEYRLYLFGIDGDALETTLSTIKELDLCDKVFYMGTKENIHDYLNAMDIMVLPSKFEGFPISAIEWQINGLPCILSDAITSACNVSGNVKFVPIDKGYDIWVEVLQSQFERKCEGVKNTFCEAGFDIKTNAEGLKRIYIDLVNKRRGNR